MKGLVLTLCFNFLRNCHIFFQIDCTILHSPSVYKGSSFSIPSSALFIVLLVSILVVAKWYFIVVLIFKNFFIK